MRIKLLRVKTPNDIDSAKQGEQELEKLLKEGWDVITATPVNLGGCTEEILYTLQRHNKVG